MSDIDSFILNSFSNSLEIVNYLCKNSNLSNELRERMLYYIFNEDDFLDVCGESTRRVVAMKLFKVYPGHVKEILAYLCHTFVENYSLDNNKFLNSVLELIFYSDISQHDKFSIEFIDELLEIKSVSDMRKIFNTNDVSVIFPDYYVISKVDDIMGSSDEELKGSFISLIYSQYPNSVLRSKIMDSIFNNNDVDSLVNIFNRVSFWLSQYFLNRPTNSCEAGRARTICSFLADYFERLTVKVGNNKDIIINLIIDNLYILSSFDDAFLNISLINLRYNVRKFIDSLDSELQNYMKSKLYFVFDEKIKDELNRLCTISFSDDNLGKYSDDFYSAFDKYIDKDDSFIKVYFCNLFKNIKGYFGSVEIYSRCFNRLVGSKGEFIKNLDFINFLFGLGLDISSLDIDNLYDYLNDFINAGKIDELFNLVSKYKLILKIYLNYLYNNNYDYFKYLIVNGVIEDDDNDILSLLINYKNIDLIIEYSKNYDINDIDSLVKLITEDIVSYGNNDVSTDNKFGVVNSNVVINIIYFIICAKSIDNSYMEYIIDGISINNESLRKFLSNNFNLFESYIQVIMDSNSGFIHNKAIHLYNILSGNGCRTSKPTRRVLIETEN